MPTYSYECPACHTKASRLRKVAAREDPVHCPACAKQMTRNLAAPPFVLRGSGWASDGYQK